MSLHQSIPTEPIRVFELKEDFLGVIEIEEARSCREIEKAARSVGVFDESGGRHLSMNLEELFGIEAFFQVGF